jgi:hypothetical protein
MAYTHTRKKQWARQPGVTRVGPRVLVDVLATVLLIGVIGAIWLCGLIVLIDFNNSHSHKEWAGLLNIPIVAWFFFWPLAYVWGWKFLQRKLGGPATFQEQ